jgi:drug/metabolite transporter (DMT)-like permease
MKSELLPIVHKKTLDKKFIVLIIATTLAGLANGVSFAQMARMMSDITYAPWLLYATALPYTVLYFIMVYLLTPASEIRSCRLFWYYFVLGVFGVGLAGVTSQFGDGYVSPTLQALVQSLQIPFTAIGIKLFMTDRFGMASAAEPISCLMWCGV